MSVLILTQISSRFRCPDKITQLISILALKKVIFNRYIKTRPMPIHHTEMKSFSTTHTTTKFISSCTGIKSSSICHAGIKSIWATHTIPVSLHANIKKHVSFAIRSKTKSISITHTTTKSISSHTLKSSQIRFLTLKPSKFRPPTQNRSQFSYLS